ncbi:Late competence development protein ComFB [Allopseudospirillum japonicum]|uniref:Late competence development protein ComFB n=1 Tax=Allopseudospirillum japonicum TaxID=64971 RepID=A0A1H6RTG3_9GAMM|nr:late competence development ComFB family protein [Allopseudospirillum japonicum]SEI56744.1 Late competence development protein ComFB [Allopseudospirillum japonicum]
MRIENIHNYYEKLLRDRVSEDTRLAGQSQDFIEDVLCLTLNQLEPRYIRFDVDMAFFLSPHEYERMQARIDTALNNAIERVSRFPEYIGQLHIRPQ